MSDQVRVLSNDRLMTTDTVSRILRPSELNITRRPAVHDAPACEQRTPRSIPGGRRTVDVLAVEGRVTDGGIRRTDRDTEPDEPPDRARGRIHRNLEVRRRARLVRIHDAHLRSEEHTSELQSHTDLLWRLRL